MPSNSGYRKGRIKSESIQPAGHVLKVKTAQAIRARLYDLNSHRLRCTQNGQCDACREYRELTETVHAID